MTISLKLQIKKMRKKQLMNRIIVVGTIFFMGTPSISAQVTIGALKEPHAAAVLDLSQKEDAAPERGLLLPQVNLVSLNSFDPLPNANQSTAAGMVVFNKAYVKDQVYQGLYVWDGTKWGRLNDGSVPTAPAIETCSADYYPHDPSKYVDIKVDEDGTGGGTTIGTLRFLTYNLGANPNLTPKQQMAYVSTNNPNEDVSVYGGLYQWGRKDAPHSLRCANSDPNTGYFIENSQYVSAAAANDPDTGGKFVWGVTLANDDWIDPQEATLWGNGLGIAGQATPLTPTQNTNNPCPPGFRVPTLHEWSLLGLEDGGPASLNQFDTDGGIHGTTPNANNPVTWVPVAGGVASISWSDNKICGYALYEKGVWEQARELDGYFNEGSLDMTKSLTEPLAPNPLLFLPAAGLREPESGVFTAGIGMYWSSTVANTNSYCHSFASGAVMMNGAFGRSVGGSVRCVGEQGLDPPSP
jgi:hypothetical protein